MILSAQEMHKTIYRVAIRQIDSSAPAIAVNLFPVQKNGTFDSTAFTASGKRSINFNYSIHNVTNFDTKI